jgi:hypothetical protein
LQRIHGRHSNIELTVIEKLPLQDETPQLAVAERLVMSVETMLRLHQGLTEVVGQMEGKGLIKKRENEPNKSAKKK